MKNNVSELSQVREEKELTLAEMARMNEAVEASETKCFSEEELTRYDNLENQVKQFDARINTLERAERVTKYSDKLPQAKPIIKRPVQKHDAFDAFRAWALFGAPRATVKDEWKRSADRVGLDFTSKEYDVNLKFDMSSDTSTEGIELMDAGLFQGLVEAQKAFGNVLSYADVLYTQSGTPIKFAINDDTSNLATRKAQLSEVTDTELAYGTSVTLTCWDYSSGVYPVSLSLLEDAQTDVSGSIGRALGTRLLRACNADWTSGNGSNKAKGYLADTTQGASAYTNEITVDDIYDMYFTLDAAYLDSPRTAWAMHPLTLRVLMENLVDDNNRPIWGVGVDGSPKGSLLGKPIILSSSMPTGVVGQSKKVIAFGDFDSFKIRIVGNGPKLIKDESFYRYLAVGFVAYMRTDSALVDAGTHPLLHLTTGALSGDH